LPGFRRIQLSGTAPHVQCFDSCFKPAKITETELASTARAERIGLLASVRSSGDDFTDKEVFTKTLEELDCGWLLSELRKAPLSAEGLASSSLQVTRRKFASSMISALRA
jgi:hypothetical protein